MAIADIFGGSSSRGGLSSVFNTSKKSSAIDLNDPEVLRALLKTQGVEPEEPKPGALNRFLGFLSSGETGDALYRTLEDNNGGIDFRDAYQFPLHYARSFTKRGSFQGEEDMKRYSDVIKLFGKDYLGIDPGDDKLANAGIGTAGFALDVLLDPLTYLAIGALGKAGKGVKAGGQVLTKADDVARLIGKSDELVALGKSTAPAIDEGLAKILPDVVEAAGEKTPKGLKAIIEGITGKGPQEITYKLPFGLQKEAARLGVVENPLARAAVRTFENPLRPFGGALMGTPVVGEGLESAGKALGDLFRPFNRLEGANMKAQAEAIRGIKDQLKGAEIEAAIKAGEFERAASELGYPELLPYLTEETSLEDIAKLVESGTLREEAGRAYRNVYEPNVMYSMNDTPQSVVHMRDYNTGENLYYSVAEKDYPLIEKLIDTGQAEIDGFQRLSGKATDGKVWHLSAGTPEKIAAAGYKYGGELKPSDLPNYPARFADTGRRSMYGMGGLAGLEPEYDEEGNITGFGYDPVKGAMGFAGTMVGGKAAENYGGLEGLFKKFKGIEGKPRFLVDDSLAKLDWDKLLKKGETNLTDVFDHPELSKMYGKTKYFTEEITNKLNIPAFEDAKIIAGELPDKVNGRYNPFTGEFIINKNLDAKKARSTLLHEVQHYIQDVEDFAQGGSESMFAGDVGLLRSAGETIQEQLDELENTPEVMRAMNEADRAVQEMIDDGLNPGEAENMFREMMTEEMRVIYDDDTAKMWNDLQDELMDIKTQYTEGGKGFYKRMGGEIEASEVQYFDSLSPEEKLKYMEDLENNAYKYTKEQRGIRDDSNIINLMRSDIYGEMPASQDLVEGLGKYGGLISKQQEIAEAAREPFERITGKGTLDNYLGRTVENASKQAEEAAQRVGMSYNGYNPVKAYEGAINSRIYETRAAGELAGVKYSTTGKKGKEAAKKYARQVGTDIIRTERAKALDNFIENNIKNGVDDLGERVAIQTDEAVQGYKDIAGIPSLKGWKVRDELADELTKMHKAFFTDEGTNQFLRYYDKTMGAWKLSVTGLFPSFHVRNFIGNNYLNWLADVNPKYQKDAIDVQKYMKAVIDGSENTDKLAKKKIGNYTIEEIFNLAKDRAVMGSGPTIEAIDMAGGETALKKLGLGKVENLARGVGTSVEDNAKIAHFIDKLVKTGDPDEAALSVKKYLFDYSDLTDFEKNVMRRVIPFYTFMRKNLELHITEMFNNPRKLRTLAKGLAAIKGTTAAMSGMTEEDVALMPDWAKKSLGIYTGKEGDIVNLVASFGLPIEQLDDLVELSKPTFGENVKGTVGNLINQSSPLLKTPIEMASGYNFFREQPIEDDTSANAYRSIIETLGSAGIAPEDIGVRTYTYEDRTTGEERTGYSMDAETKYLLNALAGKSASTATRASSALSGDAPANNLVSLLSGVRNYEFDLGRQQYYADKDEKERLQKLLIEMGLLSEFTQPYLTDEAKEQGLASLFR